MSGKSAIRTAGGGRLGHLLSGLAVAVGCALFLGGFGWAAVLYQPYTVPTGSMEPTVDPGDKILAERIDGSQVRRGDVVVFTDTAWGGLPMIKRVVGVGGDEVACCDRQGRLMVNGKAVEEGYLAADDARRAALRDFSATVPEGDLFLLGDNRSESQDSRLHLADGDHGTVPRDAVSARVDATAWPAGRLGMLDRAAASSAFAALPGGVSQPGPVRWCAAGAVIGALLVFGGAAYGPVARLSGRRAG